ncbi:uncharacterized protein METZ01_LOCUS247644, partial [marine metagenome]
MTFTMISFVFSQKINLNTDNLDALKSLDLTNNQINEIINYRNNIGQINTIYELMVMPNINISDIHSIRNLVTIEILQNSTFEKDMQRASYKLGQWI